MLQGLFCSSRWRSSFSNLVADLLYSWFDPAREGRHRCPATRRLATVPRPVGSARIRRRSLARAAGSRSRGSGPRTARARRGIAGLVILLLFILMAIFAPLLADKSGLDVTQVNGPIRWRRPRGQYPLGTDDLRPVGAHARHLGITDLLCWSGLAGGGVSMTVGSALGIFAGYRGGRVGRVLMRLHGLVPGAAVFLPLAGHPPAGSTGSRCSSSCS